MGKVGQWFKYVVTGMGLSEPVEVPQEVQEASQTLQDYHTDSRRARTLERQENKRHKVTRGEWEGLKFDLSFLQSQMSDVLAAYPIPDHPEEEEDLPIRVGSPDPKLREAYTEAREDLTLEGILADLKAEIDAKEDWGQDTPWDVRSPQLVSIENAPEGLLFGPYVLLTPEEQTDIAAEFVGHRKCEQEMDALMEEAQRELTGRTKQLASALTLADNNHRERNLQEALDAVQTQYETSVELYDTAIEKWRALSNGHKERIAMLEGALRNRSNQLDRAVEVSRNLAKNLQAHEVQDATGFTDVDFALGYTTGENNGGAGGWTTMVEKGPE